MNENNYHKLYIKYPHQYTWFISWWSWWSKGSYTGTPAKWYWGFLKQMVANAFKRNCTDNMLHSIIKAMKPMMKLMAEHSVDPTNKMWDTDRYQINSFRYFDFDFSRFDSVLKPLVIYYLVKNLNYLVL